MKKVICFLEIFLMIMAGVSFSYISGQTNDLFIGDYSESFGVKKTREILFSWISSGIVSAQSGASLWTCPENLNGTNCQEYSSSTCNSQCNEQCFPGRRNDFAQCRLGTCVDNIEGTCLPNTPQLSCTSSGGQWFEQTPAQCNPGCCIIGDQTRYVTEGTCSIIGNRLGTENEWRPGTNEVQCLLLARQQEEGACVLSPLQGEEKNQCKFGTKAECLSLGGTFRMGLLCSNPELNTACERQKTTSCFDGLNEVYWIDSCGNRENIYDSNKIRSWNSGEVMSKQESCSLQSGNNPLGNQRSCGNCEYLLGSICGTPSDKDKNPINGEFVCKDLSCIDDSGQKRKNGESWCAFDSSIGLDEEDKKNLERSVDVPGSRHYRQVCFDGEVRTEACADFRNEVCVEQRDEEVDFSAAACRTNLWQVCLESNTEESKLDKCEENTDCSLHGIEIDKFEFDICVPKYPPGFDLKVEGGGEVGQSICSIGSQTCTVIEEKKISGWTCVANCDCLEKEFAESMNNLCMSLGDCGGHVNLAGEYTDDGYRVYEDDDPSEKAGNSYVDGLKKYVSPRDGQKVEPLSNKELAALFGVPETTFEDSGKFGDFLGKIGLGATGVFVLYGMASGVPISNVLGGAGLVNSQGAQVLGSYGNAFAGAAAGAAIGFLIGKAFGLQGDALTLVTLAGAAAGIAASAGVFGPNATVLFSTGFLIAVVVVVILVAIVLKLLGIGKTREIEVKFECNAWQPPTGGADCSLCGENGLPCSKYKCQSYGQACEFINEGTDAEACVNVGASDSSPPIISFNEEILENNYKVESTENGVFIKSNEGDGCIKSFTPVAIGIKLNEYGQCKVENVHTQKYDDMNSFFGGSNLYKDEHEMVTIIPPVEGIDPERREDYNLYVRCQDYAGNKNVQEYNINFCVQPGDDLTAPVINKFVPEIGYASLNASEKQVQFYTNEPSKCKYDLEDKPYELMRNNSVICNNALRAGTLDGWLCGATLPVANEAEKNYYFRCADQPWLAEDEDEENDEKININAQSFVYKIIKSQNNLLISSVDPNNREITSGTEPVVVQLSISTTGGIDNGKAFCEYSFAGERFIDFFETSTNSHRQKFTGLFAGDYNISLQCTDKAGNLAKAFSQFNIKVDNLGPEITRAYQQPRGSLNVITNEPAECRYDINSCNFNFVNGSVMSGQGLIHTSSMQNGLKYYVKCRDSYGNAGMCLTFTGGY